MTVLSAIQKASLKLGIERPAAVMSATEQTAMELAELANEVAERIAKEAEWETLKALHTFTGDGATTEFALPSDFDRFPKHQAMRTSRSSGACLEHVLDHDVWLERLMMPFNPTIGSWTKLGGEIVFSPALTSTELVKTYYFTNQWARNAAGDAQNGFTADDDTFRLEERLLTLGLIWQHKADKGLDYTEDMENFEIAKADAIARDKGPREFAIGRPTWPRGVDIAYPEALG